MNIQAIKKFLHALGFYLVDGKNCFYEKKYKNYILKADLDRNFIDYGTLIKVERNTTSNFNEEENLVVLECVDRLLNKGYSPDKIVLEKAWTLGHKDKGFLDVWVLDEKNKSFLMIECKTWGDEYEKFVKKTKNSNKNGGQLFSYLQQEPKETKAVCYYTSRLENGCIEYKNSIIHNKEDWFDKNQEERYQRWSGVFEENGIFEDWVNLYNLESKAILRKNLKPLNKEDGDNIYNKFAEILRHNVVSDKPNAFNKIINLFLCKVYDEDRQDNEEVKFQTKTSTREKTNEELLEDLNDLYKKGMLAYLEKDISDYTKDEISDLLNGATDKDRKELEKIYRTLRLYKNNEFAFKEVFDEKSFNENAKVVREVVELLQDKQLRYGHKQQFLGDFFEKLLNDSIKQEAGQFFTPVPLTQFIVKSLPLREFIQNKIQTKEEDVLPFLIDFACGAGHFLTEIMDELQKIINKDIDLQTLKPNLKKEIESWRMKEFDWAKKYVYGIDLDYRLIKTSKISCFLNGDGLANLIHADGLANFSSSSYLGVLKTDDENEKSNNKFDILISNPPYSVKAFKNNMEKGNKSFDLYKNLTDDSKEIECLFIERMSQLMKENGLVAIVLPISILSNSGIYEKSRELILKNFNIKAIVSLGSNAFMATGTKTVILFMQKRSQKYWEKINKFIDSFLLDYKDISLENIENVFSNYVKENFQDLNLNDYISILKGEMTDTAISSELAKDYKNLNNNEIINIEREKLLYFLLSVSSKIILSVISDNKDEEKFFYGYDFSNRRGYEGINIYKDNNGKILSSLYDEEFLNKEKLNYYILKNFNNEDLENDISLIKESNNSLKNINYLRLSELIDFNGNKFEKKININLKKKTKIESKYELIKLSEVLESLESGNRPKGGVRNIKNGIISIGGEHISTNGGFNFKKIKYVSSDFYNNSTNGKIKIGDILICKDGALTGKVSIVNKNFPYKDAMVNEHVFILRADNKNLLQDYLFYYLFSNNGQMLLKEKITGSAQGGLNRNNLLSIKIPIPPLDIQNKIVSELKSLEVERLENDKNIYEIENKIDKISNSIKGNGFNVEDICLKITDGSHNPPKKQSKTDYIMLSAQNIKNNELDLNDFRFISEEDFIKENKRTNVEKDDVLLTIVGTIGRSLLVKEGMPKFTLQRSVAVFKLNKNIILPDFFNILLKTENIQNKINSLAHGTSQKGIYLNDLKSIKILIPDIKEQKNILEQILPLENELNNINLKMKDLILKNDLILNKYL